MIRNSKMAKITHEAADRVLGLQFNMPGTDRRREEAAMADLARLTSYDRLTNMSEQNAMGKHVVSAVDGMLIYALDRMCETEGQARHKPVPVMVAMETCRLMIAQLEALQRTLTLASADAMATYVGTLPEEEADQFMREARERIQARIQAIAGDISIEDLLRALKDSM
jgi:hypothetical protein